MSILESPADQFALFWVHYPKKVGKREAEQAFLKQLELGSKPHEMLRALKRYRQFIVEHEVQFKAIPHAAHFFKTWRDWVNPPP